MWRPEPSPKSSSFRRRNSAASSARLGVPTGLAPQTDGTGADQCVQGTEHRQRHVNAIGIEREQAVAHAGARGDGAVFDAEGVNQGVGVEVIEVVTGGHVGRFAVEERGEIGVLTVEVEQVGGEAALLEQVRGCGRGSRSRERRLCPGFVAVEPLAERAEGEAGRLANQRLVRGFVNDEAVDAVEELLVGGGLEGGGRPGPGRLGSGHGFGGGQILAVDVGHGGGLAIVGVVAVLLVVDSGPLGPHGAHGNCRRAS